MAHVDRRIGEGLRRGIGVGDGDAAPGLAADHVRAFAFGHVGIAQRVIGIGIAVRPAVDGDRGDITLVVKPAGAEHRLKLVPDLALAHLEGGGQHVGAAGAVLVLARQARRIGIADHLDHHRIVDPGRAGIGTDADRRLDHHRSVITERRGNLPHAHGLQRAGIAQQDTGVLHRHFARGMERGGLRGGQFGHDIGDDHVVGGHDHARGSHRTARAVGAGIDHPHRLFGNGRHHTGGGGGDMFDAQHGR